MTIQTITEDAPSAEDAALAGDASRRLARFVGLGRVALRLPDAGPADEPVVLPPAAVELLVQLLAAMAADAAEQTAVGLTGASLAADVWASDDFSDWETAGG